MCEMMPITSFKVLKMDIQLTDGDRVALRKLQ